MSKDTCEGKKGLFMQQDRKESQQRRRRRSRNAWHPEAGRGAAGLGGAAEDLSEGSPRPVTAGLLNMQIRGNPGRAWLRGARQYVDLPGEGLLGRTGRKTGWWVELSADELYGPAEHQELRHLRLFVG